MPATLPDLLAETPVRYQLSEIDPRFDLLGRRIVRQIRRRGPARETAPGWDPARANTSASEVIDDLAPLGRGQSRQFVDHAHLLAVGRALHHGGHDRPAQPQGPDLGVQRLQVDGGHLRGGDLAVQYAPDIGQAHAQLPQGRHQFQPGHARRVVQPAIAVSPRRRRHQPAIRPEPDSAHRHSGTSGQLTDCQKRSVVLHGVSLAPPVTGGANPQQPDLQADDSAPRPKSNTRTR